MPPRRRAAGAVLLLVEYLALTGLAAFLVQPRGVADHVVFWLIAAIPAQFFVQLAVKPVGAFRRTTVLLLVATSTAVVVYLAALALT